MDSGYDDGVWSTYCCNSTTPDDPCVVAHSTPCSLNTGPYGGAGCPATGAADSEQCNYWYPAGLDYTLQAGDTWFWEPPPQQLRPLSELISVYHNSVGKNTVMELDFAIDRTGRVDESHAALYESFGTWIRSCYGTAAAESSLIPAEADLWTPTPGKVWSLELQLDAPVDRVVIREDLRFGQRILAYRVVATGADGLEPPFAAGKAVGNKRIHVGKKVVGVRLRLEVSTTASSLPPVVKSFAAFEPCSDGWDDVAAVV